MKIKNRKKNNEILKQRQNMVLGVVLAVLTGFIVSILGNIFYDIFVIQNTDIKDINQNAISFILFIIIFIESFLEFLLLDYNNGSNYDKGFWKRFFDFTSEEHWSAKLSKKITKYLIIFFKWSFWIIFVLSAISSKSWILLIIIVIITVLVKFKKYYENKK